MPWLFVWVFAEAFQERERLDHFRRQWADELHLLAGYRMVEGKLVRVQGPVTSGSGTADDPTDTGMQMTVTPEGGKVEA